MLWDYKQPEFYRFNEDSIWLAKEATQYLKGPGINVLDLFAGSGVVALEIAQRSDIPLQFDLLELQQDFLPFIEENLSQSKNPSQFKIFIKDFRDFKTHEQYDLIVANPPYFSLGSSRPPDDEKRSLCRHRKGFDWDEIFQFAESALSKQGKFIFLSRDDVSKFVPENRHLTKLGTKSQTNLFLYR